MMTKISNVDEWISEYDRRIRSDLEEFDKSDSLIETSFSTKRYFEYDHYSRYLDAWRLLQLNLPDLENAQVLEAGSYFPYMSYPFIDTYNWNVKVFCVNLKKLYFFKNKKCVIEYGNLCTDDLGNSIYDLIIATEVLEHLPANIFRVVERIKRALKPNGYFLVSFPMGGYNAKDYEKDLIQIEDQYFPERYRLGNPHLREYNNGTIESIVTGMKLLYEKRSTPIAYNYIIQRLYQKVV